ncbi:MAG TPA: transglycosylase SLT domain-containing protein, partial [Solirubrobacteraceae bacterium]|nr:transglycosylase SLT domain-containing protein [Solirubrobacteraceae bacterium]
ADLAALAGARAMREAYPRLFAPPLVDGRPSPDHLERAAYLALAADAARRTAVANGARGADVSFPDADPIAPTRIRVTVSDRLAGEVPVEVAAEAELAPPGSGDASGAAPGDEYPGPFAVRQGQRMRPDVASAFDRLAAAARAGGIDLVITSAFRSNAEQAALFAAHPDPRWVARPGESLHRLGTELDLGPSSAYGWLAANAPRFHFVVRYANEPWHFGYALNAASRGAVAVGADGSAARVAADFVPARYAPLFAAAAQRWSVSATLLAAQAYRESGMNPFARSGAGALGIAQLMPGTARSLGVSDPTDPAQAIDGQAHLMRDLLRRFGAVPLALAAYNAGPARVAACMCVPPIPETQAYVAAILGLLGGAGEPTGLAPGGLEVRLVA